MSNVSVEKAANILRGGGVIVAPTETVVGLIAGEPGFRKLAEIKARDPKKPVALLCASQQEAFAGASEVPPLAGKLAERYWPGSLTLVLDALEGGTVGVRVPDHEVVSRLLDAYGEPLYATSSNLAGEPPPASLKEVDRRVLERVDAVLGGETGAGESSAVVDLSGGQVSLRRPGGDLTEEKLAQLRESEDV